MHIERHMGSVVLDVLSEYPCLIITGPRQVGKTTLIQNLNEDKPREYVTFDDLTLRESAKKDPKLFLELHKPPVCFDEVQYVPELFPYIKMAIDKNHRAGDFILTGSQVYSLMRGVSESLAGRIAVLEMQGISLSEITGLKNHPFVPNVGDYLQRRLMEPLNAKSIFEIIFKGMMPSIVSGKYSDPARHYSSYISTYLQRDIREIANVDEVKFFRFLTVTAARTAQILNVQDIARDTGISVITAGNWLQILETLGIIYYLHPYSNNLLKRSVKKPKLYFYDTGLVCYLTKWSSVDALVAGAAAGAIFETFVVSEIVKTYLNSGQKPFIYYYRDIDMKEIDLIIEKDMTLYPIEIKKGAKIDAKVAKTFKVIDKSGLKRGTGAVVCLNDTLDAIDRETLIIPLWCV